MNNNASVTLSLDRAEFTQSLDETTGKVKSSFDELGTSADKLQANTRRAFSNITADTKAMAKSVSADFRNVADATIANAAAQGQVRSALKIVKDSHVDTAAAARILAAAQAQAAVAAHELEMAEEKAGIAAGSAVPQFAAASAAVRGFEGTLSIRAVERFLTGVLKLGPALQVAFPVVGALALIDVVERGREKFVEFSDTVAGYTTSLKGYYKELLEENTKIFASFGDSKTGQQRLTEVNLQIAALERQKEVAQSLQSIGVRNVFSVEGIQEAAAGSLALKQIQDQLVAAYKLQAEVTKNLTTVTKDEHKEAEKTATDAKKTAEDLARQARLDAEQKQRDLDKYNTDALKSLQANAREQDKMSRETLQVQEQGLNQMIRDMQKEAKAAEELQKNKIAAAAIGAQSEIQLDERHLAEIEKTADTLYATHRITYAKRTEIVRQSLEQQKRLELQQILFLEQLYKDDPKELEKVEAQKAAIVEKYSQRRMQLDDKVAQHQQQNFDRINSVFASSIDGMIRSQESLGQAAQQVFSDFVSMGANALEKMVANWILQHVIMRAASTTSAIADIATSAAQAGANAYAATAIIPYIGPELAPAAAATAYAGALSFEGVASARSGMVSAEEQMAFIHKNEMVLPASLSLGFQSIIGRMNSTPVGSSGDSSFNHYGDINIQSAAQDTRSLARELVPELKRLHRHGAFSS